MFTDSEGKSRSKERSDKLTMSMDMVIMVAQKKLVFPRPKK